MNQIDIDAGRQQFEASEKQYADILQAIDVLHGQQALFVVYRNISAEYINRLIAGESEAQAMKAAFDVVLSAYRLE